mmetsp:Transcript_52395/g.71836  ORF Transcript_52395/g.71836 Transcript_52395/m.71836 type:complete len:347 (+) Transcript_52395:71-1111(+)
MRSILPSMRDMTLKFFFTSRLNMSTSVPFAKPLSAFTPCMNSSMLICPSPSSSISKSVDTSPGSTSRAENQVLTRLSKSTSSNSSCDRNPSPDLSMNLKRLFRFVAYAAAAALFSLISTSSSREATLKVCWMKTLMITCTTAKPIVSLYASTAKAHHWFTVFISSFVGGPQLARVISHMVSMARAKVPHDSNTAMRSCRRFASSRIHGSRSALTAIATTDTSSKSNSRDQTSTETLALMALTIRMRGSMICSQRMTLRSRASRTIRAILRSVGSTCSALCAAWSISHIVTTTRSNTFHNVSVKKRFFIDTNFKTTSVVKMSPKNHSRTAKASSAPTQVSSAGIASL